MLTLLLIRQSAHIAPVVVAKQHYHVVGYLHASVIIIKHLLVQRPHLWRFLGRTTCFLRYDVALVPDDALHQFHVGALLHSLVAVAAHTDGHDVLSAFHAPYALPEEVVYHRLVG